jgi:hypothetical protein
MAPKPSRSRAAARGSAMEDSSSTTRIFRFVLTPKR